MSEAEIPEGSLSGSLAAQLRAGLRVIRAGNRSPMTLDGTRTYIVGQSAPVVIDPGPDDPAHVDAVAAALDGVRPVAILLTHGHGDHAGAAPALAARTGAAVWGRPESERWGATERLQEGAEVVSDAGRVVAIATPGHAPDHYAFLWSDGKAPDGGAAFVGDLMLGLGFTTFVGTPGGDIEAYLMSLDRIGEIAAALLYPAHGPPLTDPPSAIRRYRDHRIARIRQVAEHVEKTSSADAMQLVAAIYGQLDPRLQRPAEESIRAILHYLERKNEV